MLSEIDRLLIATHRGIQQQDRTVGSLPESAPDRLSALQRMRRLQRAYRNALWDITSGRLDLAKSSLQEELKAIG